MEVLMGSIILVILVIISNIISHYLVSVPTTLIQIATGLVVAIIFKINFTISADWFMLLLVAPLLYHDVKQFPKEDFWELKMPIFANAVLLVVVTTLIGGYLINWLIPAIPLALAMALAAILSPTDAVAVIDIAEQVSMPQKLYSLISGESLINDATGLILFKYAIAAFLTGVFSFQSAILDFIYVSLIAVAVGFVMSSAFYYLRSFLVQQGINDVILHTTIQILTPFIIYIVVDELLNASGIIAVVAAGVLSLNQAPVFRGGYSEIRLVANKTWEIVAYLLNGVVFVLLGIQLPSAMRGAIIDKTIDNTVLIGYVLFIWGILFVIRLLWGYFFMLFNHLIEPQVNPKPNLHTVMVNGVSGVRGSVTMATIMSLPLTLNDNTLFEQRELIIFLGSGVVITTVLVATIFLPLLYKFRPLAHQEEGASLVPDPPSPVKKETQPSLHQAMTEIEARRLMIQHAIKALKEEQSEDNQAILSDLLHDFELRLRHLYEEEDDTQTNALYYAIEKEVQELAINAEKSGVYYLIEEKKISKRMGRAYLRLLDNKQAAMTTGIKSSIKRNLATAQKQLQHVIFRFRLESKEDDLISDSYLLLLEKRSSEAAIEALLAYKESLETDTRQERALYKNIVNQLLHDYRNKLTHLGQLGEHTRIEYQRTLHEYYLKALNAERMKVQELYEKGNINLSLANQLRQSVNYHESSLLISEE